jgi:hypothetical protein
LTGSLPQLKNSASVKQPKKDPNSHISQQGEPPMKFRMLAFTAALVMMWPVAATTGASDGKDSTAQEPSAVAAAQKPSVVAPELKYQFNPVVDGTQVTHDFAIKNTGDGPLAITQVKTG